MDTTNVLNSSQVAGHIAVHLLAYHNMIKVYHWQTRSYAQHKATDKLFNTMIELIDKFVEELQGSWGVRINLQDKTEIPLTNMSDSNFKEVLGTFKNWLSYEVPKYLRPEDTDLTNIRDEIIGAINQCLYLLSFH
jgi:hypothetical protein